MRKTALLILACGFWQAAIAQLYVTPGNIFFIKSGTETSVDSLILIPTADLTVNELLLDKSYAAAQSVSGAEGIRKKYTFQPALAIKGIVGMYYSAAGLNGNNESELSVAYSNGGNLNITAGSTVNTATHKITKKFAGIIEMSELTAIAQPGSCSKAPSTPGAVTQSSAIKPCPGESRVFTIAPVAEATYYLWTAPAGGAIIAGQGTPEIIVAFGAGFTAASPVKVSALNACGGSSERVKNIARGSKPPAPALITGDNFGVCSRTNVPYTVADEGWLYAWSFDVPGAAISTGQGTSGITADFDPSFTIGTLSVAAKNGCGISSPRKLSNIRTVPQKPGVITGPAVICPGQLNVAYSIPPVPNATSYYWTSPGGSVLSDSVGSSLSSAITTSSSAVSVNFGTHSGNIKVKAINGCGESQPSSLAVSNACSSPKGLSVENRINIYPNPASELLHIEFAAAAHSSCNVRVTDVLGKEVLSSEEAIEEGNNQLELNVGKLAPGVYSLTLQSESGEGKAISYRQQFVVQR